MSIRILIDSDLLKCCANCQMLLWQLESLCSLTRSWINYIFADSVILTNITTSPLLWSWNVCRKFNWYSMDRRNSKIFHWWSKRDQGCHPLFSAQFLPFSCSFRQKTLLNHRFSLQNQGLSPYLGNPGSTTVCWNCLFILFYFCFID